MSWKVHDTDDVFAALRGLCSNSYRMYDPCEYRSYFDHDCDVYECAVEDAAREYERLLRHCDHQRQEIAKLTRYLYGEVPAETIDLLMGLLNEYRESGCALDESRVSWYARRLDGRTMNERTGTEQGASKVRAGSSITDDLRGYVQDWRDTPSLMDDLDRGDVDGILEDFIHIADRIDERYRRDMATAQQVGYNEGEDAAMREGWAKLPVDADGIPIHIGDRVENDERVVRIVLTDESWEPSVYIEKFPNILQEHFCHEISHYHAPTVEDVLREFAEKVIDSQIPSVHPTYEEAIAEYAARLQLTDDNAEHMRSK